MDKLNVQFEMNQNSQVRTGAVTGADPTCGCPILVVPYMWVGDFVRCHSVVQIWRARFPEKAVDMLSTTLCAPLADYMPGVRRAIVADLPRGRIAMMDQMALARRFRHERYGMALTMPRTWKSALAPFLAGIPERIGFAGARAQSPAGRDRRLARPPRPDPGRAPRRGARSRRRRTVQTVAGCRLCCAHASPAR